MRNEASYNYRMCILEAWGGDKKIKLFFTVTIAIDKIDDRILKESDWVGGSPTLKSVVEKATQKR